MTNGRANAGEGLVMVPLTAWAVADHAVAVRPLQWMAALTYDLNSGLRDCAWWPLEPLKDQDGWDD